jgi:large subunit ribosomal protein L5
MAKEAVANKNNLLGAVMALRCISGKSAGGAGRGGSGVEIVRARTGAAEWKLRAGMPVAAKVELKGDDMYDFLQSLVEFVLPRMREYPGIPISSVSTVNKSHLWGPTVAFGFPPEAMALFPQIEANIDSYARLHGFHVYCNTNLKGDHALLWGRNLMTGFKIPFYRK